LRIAVTALLALVLAAGCGQKTSVKPPEPPPAPAETAAMAKPAEPAPAQPAPAAEKPATPALKSEGPLTDTLTETSLPENLFLNVTVKGYGKMKLRFHTQDAPKNVTNVANLAIKGFYNNLTFHRLIPGFMIQGGDPDGTGGGGPGYTVQAEIRRKHMKGSLAMARTGDQVNPQRRSSGSQFYICFAPQPGLDGQYTVIGELVEGVDVLGALERVPTGPQDRPRTPVVIQSATVTTQ